MLKMSILLAQVPVPRQVPRCEGSPGAMNGLKAVLPVRPVPLRGVSSGRQAARIRIPAALSSPVWQKTHNCNSIATDGVPAPLRDSRSRDLAMLSR